jgi:hypothetical protein
MHRTVLPKDAWSSRWVVRELGESGEFVEFREFRGTPYMCVHVLCDVDVFFTRRVSCNTHLTHLTHLTQKSHQSPERTLVSLPFNPRSDNLTPQRRAVAAYAILD